MTKFISFSIFFATFVIIDAVPYPYGTLTSDESPPDPPLAAPPPPSSVATDMLYINNECVKKFSDTCAPQLFDGVFRYKPVTPECCANLKSAGKALNDAVLKTMFRVQLAWNLFNESRVMLRSEEVWKMCNTKLAADGVVEYSPSPSSEEAPTSTPYNVVRPIEEREWSMTELDYMRLSMTCCRLPAMQEM